MPRIKGKTKNIRLHMGTTDLFGVMEMFYN